MRARFIATGTLLAGLAMYLWRLISHLLLPWHEWEVALFTNGDQVLATVRANAEHNGVYYINQGVLAVVDLLPGLADRSHVVGRNLLLQLAADLAVALLLALVVPRLRCSTVPGRAGVVALLGVGAGVAVYASQAIWYGFTFVYTMVNALELIIGWFIGGLVLAALARRQLPGA